MDKDLLRTTQILTSCNSNADEFRHMLNERSQAYTPSLVFHARIPSGLEHSGESIITSTKVPTPLTLFSDSQLSQHREHLALKRQDRGKRREFKNIPELSKSFETSGRKQLLPPTVLYTLCYPVRCVNLCTFHDLLNTASAISAPLSVDIKFNLKQET